MKHYLDFPTWIRPEIIPGMPFQWYGLFYLLVIVIVYLLFMLQLKRRVKENYKLMKETSEEMFIWMILAGLIGARVFYALFDASSVEFAARPWRVLWPFEGKRFVGFQGMNFYGGAAGVLCAFFIFTGIKKMRGLYLMDMILAAFPLGLVFERLGSFVNGELYGRICTMPWGVVFPSANKFPASEPWVKETISKIGMSASESLVNLPRHPAQIYELFFCGIILWIVLWFVIRKMQKFDGFLTSTFLVLYGAVRFVIEYFRIPGGSKFALRLSDGYNPPYLFNTPLNFSTGQIFALVMIIGGIVMFAALSKKSAAGSE